MEYDRIDPIGDERIDHMLALVALYIASPWTKHHLDIDDFMPRWGETEEDRQVRNTRRAMKMFGVPEDMIDG